MDYLLLGLQAYWFVNTVIPQFRDQQIQSIWREIVHTVYTQKAVTTLAQNNHEEVIMISRCSEQNQHVKKIFYTLKYENFPFSKKNP